MLVGAASINAAGTVAFFAGFRAEGAAIFAGGIGALPSINDRGIVVFWGGCAVQLTKAFLAAREGH